MTRPRRSASSFVCTGNSARSVMAEALLRQHGGDRLRGPQRRHRPKGINPLTVRVLAEAGIEPRGPARSRSTEFLGQQFDYVITVCDQARQACPVFPGRPRVAPLGLRGSGGGRGHRGGAAGRVPARSR